jgi:hypothetical protein
VLHRLGLIFTILAVFAMGGGHWAVFQGIAWTGMLMKYAQEVPIVTAVKKTFSVDAPCTMCKTIAEKRSEENHSPANLSQQKLGDIFLVGFEELLPKRPSRDFAYPARDNSPMTPRFQAPPSPVPIFVQALA